FSLCVLGSGVGFGVGFGGVEGGEGGLDRDPAAGDELAAAAAQGGGEGCGPDVFVDQDAGRAAGVVDVVFAEHAGGGAFEDGEVEFAVGVQVGDGQPGDSPVGFFADEQQV